MFLSRVTLDLRRLNTAMMQKWLSDRQPYACHQWLWQLFPQEQQRGYLFRQEYSAAQGLFYLLSKNKPQQDHNLLHVETKPFSPQIHKGMRLNFCLRANPVVTRNNKRSDVLMDAKFHAKKQGVPQEGWWELQEKAAQAWLVAQGEQRGFCLEPNMNNLSNVVAHQQQKFIRCEGENPITFSWVDYSGALNVTEPDSFLHMLYNGLGKSKALGCGLLMVKRG